MILKKLAPLFIGILRHEIIFARLIIVSNCVRYTVSNFGIILNVESERIWKEAIAVCFKKGLVSQYLQAFLKDKVKNLDETGT